MDANQVKEQLICRLTWEDWHCAVRPHGRSTYKGPGLDWKNLKNNADLVEEMLSLGAHQAVFLSSTGVLYETNRVRSYYNKT